jgi:hypothetical protein
MVKIREKLEKSVLPYSKALQKLPIPAHFPIGRKHILPQLFETLTSTKLLLLGNLFNKFIELLNSFLTFVKRN